MAVRGFRWGRAMTVFLLLWLACLLYFIVSIMTKSSETELSLQRDLDAAKSKLEKLENENFELRSFLKDAQEKDVRFKSKDDSSWSKGVSRFMDGPSKEYEMARRQLGRDVNEMWWFVKSNLEAAMKKDIPDDLKTGIELTLADTKHHQKAVLADLFRMTSADGHDSWRQREAKALSDLVQARLHSLQNPSDCTNAKKLVCNLNKGCGYGCQIHHAIYCFIVAYGTERMLVLKSKGWRYDKAGFEDVFQPLSDNCQNPVLTEKKSWPGKKDTLVVELGIIDSVNPRPEFLPPSIPKDLADRIMTLHGDPIVWWVSQFLKFMLRPQPDLTSMLKATETAQGLQHPIVGIHIRRTDKVGTEAAFHSVDEYMKYVDEFYQTLAVREGRETPVKRVYVASDDPKVLEECQEKYPHYVFLGDETVAKSAAVNSRYNSNSLRGIITDIHMLSRSDYLVCTFSSQVCRIAYEIMQQFHVDAADRFTSLDDVWYFGGQDEHQQVAVMAHEPRSKNEMELRVGDVIGVAGNHWNGFSKGKNHRTSRIGLYPGYKTKENVKIVDFPTYPHVKL